MKAVYPIATRCIDCHLCEIACIIEHSQTKSPVSAHFLEGLQFNWQLSRGYADPAEAKAAVRPSPLSRCRVSANSFRFISTMCRHCEVAECVLACKNGALYRDASGRVLVNEKKCIGCWMCIMACSYGAITRNIDRQNVPGVAGNGVNHHCDLCPNRRTPACVYVCPTQALAYEER